MVILIQFFLRVVIFIFMAIKAKAAYFTIIVEGDSYCIIIIIGYIILVVEYKVNFIYSSTFLN